VNLTQRLARLDSMRAGGRLLRGTWTEGNNRACLLAALSPEAGKAESWEKCPASVMPPWLAAMTLWMDDRGSLEAWPSMVSRYSALAHRWHVLSPETWRRLMSRQAIQVRLEPELIKGADQDAARRTAAGGTRVTRNDIVRMALRRHLGDVARPRKKGGDE